MQCDVNQKNKNTVYLEAVKQRNCYSSTDLGEFISKQIRNKDAFFLNNAIKLSNNNYCLSDEFALAEYSTPCGQMSLETSSF